MHVLIIGGTSFIGPHVVRGLLERGHQVTLFHRGQTQSDLLPAVEHVFGDRRHLADYSATFAQLAPDVVLDMIPLTEHDGQTALQTFRGVARRMVAVSSMDVYRAYDRLRRTDPGPPDPVPLTEDAPLRDQLYPYRAHASSPDDVAYHYDKILVERAVMGDPQLPATVLRLPAVYGPADRQHRLAAHLRRMDDGRPAILLDQDMAGWHFTRGYVENVAAAIVLAVTDDRAANRVYNVGEEPQQSEAAWVEAIARAACWKGRIVSLPHDQLPRHLRQDLDFAQDWQVDTSRIRRELGYAEVVALDEALQRTIAWERAYPPADGVPTQEDYAAEYAALKMRYSRGQND